MPNMAVEEVRVLALRQQQRVGVLFLVLVVAVGRLATVQEERKGLVVLGVRMPQAVVVQVEQMETLALLVVMVTITLSDVATGEAVLGVLLLQVMQAVLAGMAVCLAVEEVGEVLVRGLGKMVGAVMEQEVK
jgi:Na+/H+ antiporter NhaC